MRKNMTCRLTAFVLLAVMLMTVCTTAGAAAATTMKVSNKTALITTSGKVRLTCLYFNLREDTPTVEWTSSDETIATVSQKGLVQAEKAGVVTITGTAELEDGTVLTDSCEVTVYIPVTKLTIHTTHYTRLPMNSKLTLDYTVYPTDATYQTVLWTSEDETIATVDSNGVVTGHSAGKVVITGSVQDSNVKTRLTLVITE